MAGPPGATRASPLDNFVLAAYAAFELADPIERIQPVSYTHLFCQPCAPTKSNGQRTRNLPKHSPDKWLAFKKYNIRDVETEMSIQARLSKYPVPDSVWEEYLSLIHI